MGEVPGAASAPHRRVRVVGIGMGPHHLTAEAADALRASTYVLAAEKADDDPLLEVRREICRGLGDLPVVAVRDPQRDRRPGADYDRAVADWHAARAEAFEEALLGRDGDAAFLVWGDPSLYDSTVRVLDAISARGRVRLDYDVVPGVSSLSLLAARHRVVLHEVGRPLHVTTARRLREAVDRGERNVAVLLGREPDLDGLGEWRIWWGANLGTASERLVAGRVADVLPRVLAEREAARAEAGWVMDTSLLRLPAAEVPAP
ncbi:precorrin-6A synthase (deacetylating) [Thalassiella azotivora]